LIASRSVVNRIRAAARLRLRASKPLWKDYKRMRRSGWRHRVGKLSAVFLFYPAAAIFAFVQRRGLELPLLLLTLYSTATTLTRATNLSKSLYGSGDLAFFMHVPVSDRDFFDFEWKKFLRSATLLTFYAFLALGYVSVIAINGPLRWPAALAAALLQTLVVVTLVVLIELLFPAAPKAKFGFVFYLLTFASFFLPTPWIAALKALIVPLPTGWVPYIFEKGLLQHDARSLYILFPVVALVASLPLGLKRFRDSYPRAGILYPLAAATLVPDEDYSETSADWAEAESAPVPKYSPELANLSPVVLPKLHWQNYGWIERVVGRWISPSQLATADFLVGGNLGAWTQRWKLALKIACGGMLALLVLHELTIWIAVLAGGVASLLALPVVGGDWQGMQLRSAAGIHVIPMHALFPLSYRDVSRVIARVNLIRFAAWAPFFLIYASALGWRLGSATAGAILGLQIFIIVLSLQPLMIAGRFSYGTTDTKRLNTHSLAAIAAMVVLALAYVVCCIILFVAVGWGHDEAGSNLVAVGAVVGLFVCSGTAWSLYKLLYERGRIDLIRVADR
jgi:hypothetical protein